MDGVLADFHAVAGEVEIHETPTEMLKEGFYRNLPVMEGAKEAVEELMKLGDVYIASKPTTKNFSCATEKYEWINEHFPQLIKKVFLTCDKTLLKGDFLIDDDIRWNEFDGNFLWFDRKNPLRWEQIVNNVKVIRKLL